MQAGEEIRQLLIELFPICRSITGDGVRETLRILSKHIPLKIHEVPTGTPAFDWTVPKEWNIRDAFILDSDGNKVVDFKVNNLHVLGYSTPVDLYVSLDELQEHLHSLEALPDAIPYVTSYYEERWGFCLSHNQRKQLRNGIYRVFIDSDLKEGHLTFAECILRGGSEQEVFLSTDICHPSMANNELSGPTVLTQVVKWLMERERRYTYRIIFIPETIGSLIYLSRNLELMKKRTVAGFNVSCVGDERAVSLIPSRYGNTLADAVALTVLKSKHPDFVEYSYLDRASDERQYCSPGVDLPLVCLCRSLFRHYPEYHTSLDNLDLVTAAGLQGSYDLVCSCIELIERNDVYRTTVLGEPQLGRRGLYPTVSTRTPGAVEDMLNLLAYADGTNDLIAISNRIGVAPWDLYPIVDRLVREGLLVRTELQCP